MNALPDLGEFYCNLPDPTDDELRHLIDAGVSDQALIEPWPLRGDRVMFSGKTFDFAGDAAEAPKRALIFCAEDRGRCVDWIAWAPSSGTLASWRGVAFCLGDVDAIFNPASYFAGDGLRVHRTPLDWLRAGREGIVLLRREMAFAYLANVQRIVVADAEHGRQLRS
ncbi:MAG: hypothetical protein ACREDO_00185 [Methyloceanibacter sp.]